MPTATPAAARNRVSRKTMAITSRGRAQTATRRHLAGSPTHGIRHHAIEAEHVRSSAIAPKRLSRRVSVCSSMSVASMWASSVPI